MKAQELRQVWTDFWVAKQHTDVPASGLIPLHPSAPMFTNSGMMQFVPYFLGEEQAPYQPPRATSVQTCVRAGGKHNDLDAIGRSLRHLSFFEMLGNFSFGDYFKADAIGGRGSSSPRPSGSTATASGSPVHVDDDEAVEIWVDEVGFPLERIQRLDKDNFWEMGDTGPCGPSSELFWDFGPEMGPDGGPANPASEERFVEFWNLVFQQYFRGADGALSRSRARTSTPARAWSASSASPIGPPDVFATDELRPWCRRPSRPPAAASVPTGVRRRPAAARGPRPHHDLPGQRRRHPVQRGPGLRPAPHHPPRHPLRLPARGREAHHAADGRAHHRAHGRRVPGPDRQRRHHPGHPGAGRGRSSGARCAAAWGSSTPRWRRARRRRAARFGRVPAPRHLRLPVGGHHRDRRGPRLPARPRRGSTRRWPTSGSGPGRRQEGRADRRRRGRCVPGGPRPARHHRVRGPGDLRGRGHGRWRSSRRRRAPSASSWTARRSTPSPAARSATPARSPGPPARDGARHPPGAAGPAPPRGPHRRRRVRGRATRSPPRSTSSGATPSAATTPAPTSSTGRCARCWATT